MAFPDFNPNYDRHQEHIVNFETSPELVYSYRARPIAERRIRDELQKKLSGPLSLLRPIIEPFVVWRDAPTRTEWIMIELRLQDEIEDSLRRRIKDL